MSTAIQQALAAPAIQQALAVRVDLVSRTALQVAYWQAIGRLPASIDEIRDTDVVQAVGEVVDPRRPDGQFEQDVRSYALCLADSDLGQWRKFSDDVRSRLCDL